MTSTDAQVTTGAGVIRVADSTVAADVADAPPYGNDLDEASRLIPGLVARAQRLDDLVSQHGSRLTGFQGSFAALFEIVERTVADLIGTGPPSVGAPTLMDDEPVADDASQRLGA